MEARTIGWGLAIAAVVVGIWYFATQPVEEKQFINITAHTKSGAEVWTIQVPVTKDMTQSVAGGAVDLSQCGKELSCEVG